MFTGIIQSVGKIDSLEASGGDARVRIDSGKLDMSGVNTGDSIAVSGVCLTVVGCSASGFIADVSAETLSRTTFGRLRAGDAVNLEKALTLSTPLGGHMVSGHVDGVGTVVNRRENARSVQFRIKVPDALAKYIAEKGSVCVDGVSLTVNAIHGAEFEVNIVPHTLAETTWWRAIWNDSCSASVRGRASQKSPASFLAITDLSSSRLIAATQPQSSRWIWRARRFSISFSFSILAC
jgi:riboflavin synthase